MEVKFCKKCFGKFPCWCQHHDYITTWDFIYNAIITCKGK